jgi:hypothetical protein
VQGMVEYVVAPLEQQEQRRQIDRSIGP